MDYIGVIVGPDLVVRDGEVRTRPEMRSKMDKSLSGYKSALRTEPQPARDKAGAIIRNTYRTLMTRGMKGCYVYCTDAETAAFLRSRIREPREDESLREVAEEPAPYERS